ncbi:hypothetical protein KY290_035873 [Solanum tuberosum]|uniref:Uncharacterized protein n=1 Tax=Solanum tuberosum TaxID=4113 RepID=A0ABQ7TSP2_SOLTU|nr:hypothetical protein KY284_035240 [Solanum tuberosum]KAH0737168.1 hypothetical protein KY290_035873 [Solanum tuberosum]
MSPVRVPMEMDVATKGRTRPCMAKVQVDIDSTKPRLSHVFVGQKFYQSTARLQGHSVNQYQGRERYNEEETEGTQIRQGKLIIRQMYKATRSS